jgi:phage baseplate assembly protein gpV
VTATPDIVELIRAVVRAELAATHVAELGVVTRTHPHASASDKQNYACDVKLRDTGLELKSVPVATQRIGHAAIPNVEDLVLVSFVHGDVHNPVVIGRLYNDVDRPPVAKDREWVFVCPDDKKSGVRRAHFEFPNGNKVTLDDDKLVLEMGSTKLTVKNGGDVALESAANIDIEAAGDMTLKAGGKLALEAGSSFALKAQTDAKLEGLSISVKAQTSAEVQGSAAASLKGALVTIGGNVSFAPS